MTAVCYRPPPEFSRAASVRLDLLRLVLVAQVVLGHVAGIAYPRFAELDLARLADRFVLVWRMVTRFGIQAAVVFICISGFFLGPRLLEAVVKVPGAQPIGAFLLARLRRIYPTLIIALALTLACDLVGQALPGGEAIYRRTPPYDFTPYDFTEMLTLPVALANLLSLQPTFSPAFGSNGPLWTLGYIVQFYVAAAALAAAFGRSSRLGLALLAVLLGAGLVWKPEWGLLFGCWLACGMMRWWPARSARSGLAALLGAGGLIVAANLLGALHDPLLSAWISVLFSGLAGALLLFAVQAPYAGQGPLRLPRPLAALNQASYPVYALHYPVLVLVFTALLPHWDGASLSFRLAFPALALALVLVLAFVWQAALERLLPGGK